jgi:hypothetical protein
MVNCLKPHSTQNHLKYLFTYQKIAEENTGNSEKSVIKNVIVQKLWVMKKF